MHVFIILRFHLTHLSKTENQQTRLYHSIKNITFVSSIISTSGFFCQHVSILHVISRNNLPYCLWLNFILMRNAFLASLFFYMFGKNPTKTFIVWKTFCLFIFRPSGLYCCSGFVWNFTLKTCERKYEFWMYFVQIWHMIITLNKEMRNSVNEKWT